MFDFDSHHFSRLLKLVNQGLANVVITEITRDEILSHIREHTTEALKSLKQAVKERPVGILRHISPSFAELFKKHDIDHLVAEMESQFATFCKDSNVNILPSAYSPSRCANNVLAPLDRFPTRPRPDSDWLWRDYELS